MGLWSRRLDLNQRLPASDAGENIQASLRLEGTWTSRWSARGDSNPDLRGLNALPLPIGPRADEMVTMGGFEPPTCRLSTCRLCQGWATWSLVPPGGLEPPLHGLRARRAALTLRRGWSRAACCRYITSAFWSEWSDSNRHRKAWKACMPPLHHIRAIGSAYGIRTRPSTLATWNARLHTQAERTSAVHRRSDILQLSKTLLVSSWWAARDSNPNGPRKRTTGLQPASGPSARTARASVTPRCRLRSDRFETQFSLQTSLELARVLRPKTKKAF